MRSNVNHPGALLRKHVGGDLKPPAPRSPLGDGRNSGIATYLLWGNRPLIRLPQLLDDSRVTSQILLAANQNDWETGAEVHNLGNPLHTQNTHE